jgi:hypothetical protein
VSIEAIIEQEYASNHEMLHGRYEIDVALMGKQFAQRLLKRLTTEGIDQNAEPLRMAIGKLELRPKDILVVQIPAALFAEQAAAAFAKMQETIAMVDIANVHVLVVDDLCKFEVIRYADAKAMAEAQGEEREEGRASS